MSLPTTRSRCSPCQAPGAPVTPGPLKGILFGRYAVISVPEGSEVSPGTGEQNGDAAGRGSNNSPQAADTRQGNIPNPHVPGAISPGSLPGAFGMRIDRLRVVLSSLETVYLMQTGILTLGSDGMPILPEEYLARARATDVEMDEKVLVYRDLRDRGYTPKTGYKFGHHFRVYTGTKVHSEMLVHAVATEGAMPMSTISRSVRLSHSVKKKMLFGCVHTTGIHYIEFARIKL